MIPITMRKVGIFGVKRAKIGNSIIRKTKKHMNEESQQSPIA